MKHLRRKHQRYNSSEGFTSANESESSHKLAFASSMLCKDSIASMKPASQLAVKTYTVQIEFCSRNLILNHVAFLEKRTA